MIKRLYSGPFSAVYRNVWVERARGMQTDEWLWLLPTRHLLHTVRQQLLDGRAGLVDVPLLTFDDIAERVVKHVNQNTQLLTPYMREKIIEQLIERHADHPYLSVFRSIMDQPGLYRSVAQAIGEMKRSGLTEQAVETYLQQSESDQTEARRQQALAFMFLRYQEELHRDETNVRVDPEEMLRLACDILEDGRIPAAALPYTDIHTLWVDHFTDFTSLQLRLLRSLVKASAEVGIYIPFPREREEQLPQLAAQLDLTRHSLEQLGLQHVELHGLGQASALKLLADDWLPGTSLAHFTTPYLIEWNGETSESPENTSEAPEGLACLPASTPKREVETVAKEIKRIVRFHGIAPGDIAIIVKDDQYEPLIHEVMQRDGVPLYAHETIGLHETAVARQLLAFLRLAVSDWERRDVLCLAEGGYVRWSNQPPYGLETWVKQAGVEKGRTNWRDACERKMARLTLSERELAKTDMETEERERRKEQLARQKQKIQRTLAWLDEVQQYVDEWVSAESWRERLEGIERIWDKLDIEGRIKQLWLPALRRGEVQGYCRDLEAYRALCDMLKEMKRMESIIPDSTRRSRQAFVQEFRNLLTQKQVIATRGQPGGVRLMDPSAARGASFDAVFILGLNEGSFPSHYPEDWLIRDAERVAFHGGQARLPASYAHNEMEQMFFEMAVYTARRHLVLSYISPEADEQVLRSRFLEQLEHRYGSGSWLAPERFKEAMESRLFARTETDITSPQEYRNRLMAEWAEKGDMALPSAEDPIYRDQQQYVARLIEHAQVEQERHQASYGRWEGHLRDPRIHERLKREFSHDRTYSVSWMNDYAACPLHFFFSRVLGVQPLEETEQTLSSLETGNVLHEVLRRLFTSDLDCHMCDRSLEEWQFTLQSVFEAVTAEWEQEHGQVLSPLWSLEKGRLYRILQSWLQHEYTRQGRRRFKPRHVEFSFGLPLGERVDTASSNRPIALSLANETLQLVGRIDRIDHDEDDHFVLYDYKLSTNRYEGCHQLEETTNFQLPLYVLAYQKWLEEQGRSGKPVGAGFYGLRPQDKFKKIGLWEKASLTDLGLGNIRSGVTEDVLKTAETVLERVADLLDGIRHGRFYMLPEHEPNPYYGDQAVYRNEATALYKVTASGT